MSDDMENFSNELDSIIDNLSKLEFSKKEEASHQLLESSARLTSLSNQLPKYGAIARTNKTIGGKQMIKTYRKIATISAEQFDGSDKQIKKYGIRPPYPQEIGTITDEEWRPLLPTKEGLMTCHVGDWVATGINGEHWPIADDIFKKTYVEVKEK
nr:hypothetical protein [Lentilactobacillus buchneri]